MSEPFIGEVKTWPLDYAPRGWSFCEGQLLPITQNQTLYAIIGTVYGGDGRSTFALPDLRGRAPMHKGRGIGLTNRAQGLRTGVSQVTLTTSQIPAHNHTLMAGDVDAETGATSNACLAKGGKKSGRKFTPIDSYSTNAPATTINSESLQIAGGHQAHDNMQPYLSMNMCIALIGVFPSRS